MTKLVKGIFIDSKNKRITKVKFNSSYDYIQDILENDIFWSQLFTNDLVWFEFPQDKQVSEHFVEFGGKVYRGNLFISGDVTEDSTEYNWSCKNVSAPFGFIKQHTRFLDISEITFEEKEKEMV